MSATHFARRQLTFFVGFGSVGAFGCLIAAIAGARGADSGEFARGEFTGPLPITKANNTPPATTKIATRDTKTRPLSYEDMPVQ
ncbi:MAG TPA: hypothetical protein PKD84_03425 [Propionicimonas sp.]|nr:hypothetical protein [Propionicimonas sp.]